MPKHVTIHATRAHQERHAALSDPLWSQLKNANSADIEAFLATADEKTQRRVLGLLLVAVRHLLTGSEG